MRWCVNASMRRSEMRNEFHWFSETKTIHYSDEREAAKIKPCCKFPLAVAAAHTRTQRNTRVHWFIVCCFAVVRDLRARHFCSRLKISICHCWQWRAICLFRKSKMMRWLCCWKQAIYRLNRTISEISAFKVWKKFAFAVIKSSSSGCLNDFVFIKAKQMLDIRQ